MAQAEEVTYDGPRLWRWPARAFDPSSRVDVADAEGVMRGEFRFLNDTRLLGAPPDWKAPGTSRLWRFHLHSAGWALALAVASRKEAGGAYESLRTLVQDWLAGHSIDASDAWHPFVVSGRLVNLLQARSLLLARDLRRDAELDRLLRRSLLEHALFLDEHLETDVGGNHLLKNAVALLAAGCAFEGRVAERWRTRAAAMLERELRIQVLPDGGHYERSPMYHLLVLEDLLLALHVAGLRELPIANPLADAVRRMQPFARAMRHPDGEIPLFNDAVLGEAPRPEKLFGPSTRVASDGGFPDSGYFLLPLEEGVLIIDVGAPGPDDLPAHVHADALSYEVSIGTQRVLVDGGMVSYEPGLVRQQMRGTAWHNTISVDGQDQSEVWATFRVGSRARVSLERWAVEGDTRVLVGSHDGYARIGVARHRREIRAVPSVGWRVVDTLLGDGRHEAVSRLRLHPRFHWLQEGSDWRAVDAEGQTALRVRVFGGTDVDASVERSTYAERFGELQEASVLTLRLLTELPRSFGYWLLLPDAEPQVA